MTSIINRALARAINLFCGGKIQPLVKAQLKFNLDPIEFDFGKTDQFENTKEKKRTIINQVFTACGWKGGLLETAKKEAIKLALKDRITTYKKEDLSKLVIAAKELRGEAKLTPETLDAHTATLLKKFSFFKDYEIRFILQNLSTKTTKNGDVLEYQFSKENINTVHSDAKKRYEAQNTYFDSITYRIARETDQTEETIERGIHALCFPDCKETDINKIRKDLNSILPTARLEKYDIFEKKLKAISPFVNLLKTMTGKEKVSISNYVQSVLENKEPRPALSKTEETHLLTLFKFFSRMNKKSANDAANELQMFKPLYETILTGNGFSLIIYLLKIRMILVEDMKSSKQNVLLSLFADYFQKANEDKSLIKTIDKLLKERMKDKDLLANTYTADYIEDRIPSDDESIADLKRDSSKLPQRLNEIQIPNTAAFDLLIRNPIVHITLPAKDDEEVVPQLQFKSNDTNQRSVKVTSDQNQEITVLTGVGILSKLKEICGSDESLLSYMLIGLTQDFYGTVMRNTIQSKVAELMGFDETTEMQFQTVAQGLNQIEIDASNLKRNSVKITGNMNMKFMDAKTNHEIFKSVEISITLAKSGILKKEWKTESFDFIVKNPETTTDQASTLSKPEEQQGKEK